MKNRYSFSAAHWGTIFICFLLSFLTNSVTSDSENVILPKLAAVNDWDYFGIVLTIASVAGCVSILGTLLLGKLCEKKGPKFIIMFGLIASTCFMFLYGTSTNYVTLTIGLIGCICCGQCLSFLGGSAVIVNWFPQKKGLAMGFVSIGPPAASMIMVSVLTVIINKFGVHAGTYVICGILIITMILCILFIHNTPEEVGKTPDNIPVAEADCAKADVCNADLAKQYTTRSLLKNKNLWLIIFIIGVCSLSQTGLMAQWIVRYTESGFTETQAGLYMSVCAVIGIFGSMVTGFVENKLGTKKGYAVLAVWFSVAFILNFTNIQILVYISVVMFGFVLSLLHIFMPAFVASAFGRDGFKQANAIVFPLISLCGQLSFLTIAACKNIFGEVRYAYLVFAVLLLATAVAGFAVVQPSDDSKVESI